MVRLLFPWWKFVCWNKFLWSVVHSMIWLEAQTLLELDSPFISLVTQPQHLESNSPSFGLLTESRFLQSNYSSIYFSTVNTWTFNMIEANFGSICDWLFDGSTGGSIEYLLAWWVLSTITSWSLCMCPSSSPPSSLLFRSLVSVKK